MPNKLSEKTLPVPGAHPDPFVVVFAQNKILPVGYVDRASNIPAALCEHVTRANGKAVYISDAPVLFSIVKNTYNQSLAQTEFFALPIVKTEEQAEEFNLYWEVFPKGERDKTKSRILQEAEQYARNTEEKKINRITLTSEEREAIKKDLRAIVEKEANKASKKTSVPGPKPQLQPLLQELDAMVGLDSVKKHIHRLVAFHKVVKSRKEAGIPAPSVSNHLSFEGPPGTGKTTIARLVAKIYYSLGITETDNFVETDRSGLVGQYIGATASKTNKKIAEAKGGGLFIDEAYALASGGGDRRDFGHEAIATLLKAMEDKRDNLVVIFAGYEKEMELLWNSNSGLKSRVPARNKIAFSSYEPTELAKIAADIAKSNVYNLADCAQEKIKELAKDMNKDEMFGNGRWARDLVETAILNHAVRVLDDKSDLQTILKQDVEIDVDCKPEKSFGFGV